MNYLKFTLGSLGFVLAVSIQLPLGGTAAANPGDFPSGSSYFSKYNNEKIVLRFEALRTKTIDSNSPRHRASLSHRQNSHHKSVAPEPVPLSVQCLNELTAHNGQNYIDRISEARERKRLGAMWASERLRHLGGIQRNAYAICVSPLSRLDSKRKASKAQAQARPGKSVVSLLRERKDFVVPSAGLRIQPDGRHVPSKPAIIYATDAAPRSQDFVLGGRKLTIRFTPVKYTADLGDGGPVLEQAEVPLPYPGAFKGHFYRKFTRSGTFIVGMRTFWRVEWFNPVTGGWVTEGEQLVSVQKTNPQVVKPYQYVLTDDAEEQHGR